MKKENEMKNELTDKIHSWKYGLILNEKKRLTLADIAFNEKSQPMGYEFIVDLSYPKNEYEDVDEVYKLLGIKSNTMFSEINRLNEIIDEMRKVSEIKQMINDVQTQIATNHIYKYTDFKN